MSPSSDDPTPTLTHNPRFINCRWTWIFTVNIPYDPCYPEAVKHSYLYLPVRVRRLSNSAGRQSAEITIYYNKIMSIQEILQMKIYLFFYDIFPQPLSLFYGSCSFFSFKIFTSFFFTTPFFYSCFFSSFLLFFLSFLPSFLLCN